MYSFLIRQFIWEYIGDFLVFGGKVPFMYSFSIRQFIWEYIGYFFFLEGSSLMYSFSIRQFIWEYIGDSILLEGKVPLCIRFQLGNSFGNT